MASKFQPTSNHRFGINPPVIEKINFHTIKDMDNRYAKEFRFNEPYQHYHKHQEKTQEEEFEIHNAYEKEKEEVIDIQLNAMIKQKPVPFVNTNMFLKKNNKSIF